MAKLVGVAVDVTADTVYEAIPAKDHVSNAEATEGAVFKIPIGVDTFRFAADRSLFPDVKDQVVNCEADISYDGGETWDLLCAFTAAGEEHVVDGVVSTESGMIVGLLQETNPNRLIRTRMILSKSCSTSVTAKFSQSTG